MNDWYENIERDTDIVCPYCGETYDTIYGEAYINDESVECFVEVEQKFTCENCGKKFKLMPYIEWKYETKTIDGEMTEEEHDEKW